MQGIQYAKRGFARPSLGDTSGVYMLNTQFLAESEIMSPTKQFDIKHRRIETVLHGAGPSNHSTLMWDSLFAFIPSGLFLVSCMPGEER